MVYALARQREPLWKEGLPTRTVWLVIKRTLGADPVYAYAISPAPASTPLQTFLWLRCVHWADRAMWGCSSATTGRNARSGRSDKRTEDPWVSIFYTTKIIFVVKNIFQAQVFPPYALSPEEAEDLGSTSIGAYPK
jgi:hypothetical protein